MIKPTEQEAETLINALIEAHYDAAINNTNISKMVALSAFDGSDNVMQAVAAGLLSTGHKHGPLTETRALLSMYDNDPKEAAAYMRHLIQHGEKIPGLGNSFFKDRIDPSFKKVVDAYNSFFVKDGYYLNDEGRPLFEFYVHAMEIINEVRPDAGKINLFLNASAITAGICNFVGATKYFENWIFITGRSRAWIEIFASKSD